MTKSELVRLAQDGDRDAFDLLLTAVIDHLYRIARLILRDYDSAEDAVQEALVIAGGTFLDSGTRTDRRLAEPAAAAFGDSTRHGVVVVRGRS